ncbi:uncharacterized protein LOC100176859 [Ciona intestinalis]
MFLRKLMFLRMLKVLLFCHIFYLVYSTKLEVDHGSSSDVANKQLQQIYQHTKNMRYGKCWTDALQQLKDGCRNLSDEMQRRIAYAFARCHLQSAGRKIPVCESDQDMADCTSDAVLEDVAFNTYTEFFTHSQQICFHLQSQVWHEATENTISQLADNSAQVAATLETSSEIAKEMVVRQNDSLKNQEELLRNERLLRENMQRSVMDVQRSHEETKMVIKEQRALFAEVFDRVAALQKTVLGEFTSVYTFGFYVGAAFLAYIMTSTSRTGSARIWLFILITLNFVTERAVVNYHLAPTLSSAGSMYVENTVLPETVYDSMWMCRKIYTCIALFTMFICIIRYKDYNKINYNLLNEIKRQNMELQTLLKEQGITSIHSLSQLNTPTKQFNEQTCQDSSFLTNTTVIPYDSDADTTYVASNSDSESTSTLSCTTGHDSSCSSLALNDTITSMVRSFHRSSTPSREDDQIKPRRRRRSSISSNVSLMEQLSESVVQTEGVLVGGYNLRKRRSNPTNPALDKESVSQFIGAVERVTAKWRLYN